MAYEFNRGSEWRKCDFHVHTPESKLNSKFGTDWDKYVKEMLTKALENNIEIIGITDYYSIEGYKKLKKEYLENYNKLKTLFTQKQIEDISRILILPNLEFRINKLVLGEKKGVNWERKVNFHIIFSNDISIDDIEENFIKKLYFENLGVSAGKPQRMNITNRNLETLGAKLIKDHPEFGQYDKLFVGMMNASVDDLELINVLNEQKSMFQGKYLLSLPADEDLSAISWNSGGHLARKVLIQKSHVLLSSNPNTILFGLGKKHPTVEEYLEEFVTLKACIWGSDAHDYDRLFKVDEDRFTWIKADCTFEGVCQILYEPEIRVFIGESPPQKDNVEYNSELFIDAIKISTVSDNDEWFDKTNTILINPGLVSIIGNKGSGKSALADIIGSAGNANTGEFSFLRKGKFLDLSCSKKYAATISMRDGYTDTKQFTLPQHDNVKLSKVVYFSQSFVQQLCDEMDTVSLEKEINRVVFAHIPEEEQQGVDTLEELLKKKNSSIDSQISDKKRLISQFSETIEKLEKQSRKDNIDKLKSKLEEKERQLKELKKNEPTEITDPTKKPDKATQDKLKKLQDASESLTAEITLSQNLINELVKEKESIIQTLEDIKYFKENYDGLKKTLEDDIILKKYAINIKKIIDFNSDVTELDALVKKIEKSISESKKSKIKKEGELKEKDDEIKKISKNISEKANTYKKYLEELTKWNKKIKEISGEANIPESKKYYENQLKIINNENPKELQKIYDKLLVESKEILRLIFEKKELLPSIYSYATNHATAKAEEFGIKNSDFIEFDSNIKLSKNFRKDFLSIINQLVKGTFRGIEDGDSMVKDIIKEIKFDEIDSLISIPSKLIYALKYNISTSAITSEDIDTQMLKGKRTTLYEFLFSYDYLTINSEITYGGVRIPNLSPGERGTLLLIFYLLIDKDRRPIIIDQPEENLDNETVYQKLVPFVRNVKNERQILLVTHNPNLAIVCDSDQIIQSHIDKDNKNLVTYTSGSIEYAHIRTKALNILEGTKPAFISRKNKYKVM